MFSFWLKLFPKYVNPCMDLSFDIKIFYDYSDGDIVFLPKMESYSVFLKTVYTSVRKVSVWLRNMMKLGNLKLWNKVTGRQSQNWECLSEACRRLFHNKEPGINKFILSFNMRRVIHRLSHFSRPDFYCKDFLYPMTFVYLCIHVWIFTICYVENTSFRKQSLLKACKKSPVTFEINYPVFL